MSCNRVNPNLGGFPAPEIVPVKMIVSVQFQHPNCLVIRAKNLSVTQSKVYEKINPLLIKKEIAFKVNQLKQIRLCKMVKRYLYVFL